MTVYAAPGATFEANVRGASSGLVGTMGVRISNLVTDTDFLARTIAGIAEYPAASGIYSRSFIAPTVATSGLAAYSIVWDDGSAFATEDLVVTSSSLVTPVPGPGDLTTVAEVKSAISITTSSDDPLIQTLITSASKAIEARYQREFAAVSGTPTRRIKVKGCWVNLAPYDLRSVSAVTLNPESASPLTLTANTDYALQPVTLSSLGTYTELKLSNRLTLTGSTTVQNFGYALIDITGTWGAAAIPSDVARACIITTAAWLDRGADQIAGMDSTVRPDGSTMSTSWAIPNAAHRLLQQYERVTVYLA